MNKMNNSARITIMLENEIVKEIKKKQARIIKDGGNASFSSEINKALRKSLKL